MKLCTALSFKTFSKSKTVFNQYWRIIRDRDTAGFNVISIGFLQNAAHDKLMVSFWEKKYELE